MDETIFGTTCDLNESANCLLENQMITVNGERFAEVNFCVFQGFQEYRESFSMNISASL